MAKLLEDCRHSAIHDRIRAWRRLEALESVDHFRSRAGDAEEYTLNVAHVESLLEDCFLAPIGDQGPSLLWGAADKPSMQGPGPVIVITTSPADTQEPAWADNVPPQPPAPAGLPPVVEAPSGPDEPSVGQEEGSADREFGGTGRFHGPHPRAEFMSGCSSFAASVLRTICFSACRGSSIWQVGCVRAPSRRSLK